MDYDGSELDWDYISEKTFYIKLNDFVDQNYEFNEDFTEARYIQTRYEHLIKLEGEQIGEFDEGTKEVTKKVSDIYPRCVPTEYCGADASRFTWADTGESINKPLTCPEGAKPPPEPVVVQKKEELPKVPVEKVIPPPQVNKGPLVYDRFCPKLTKTMCGQKNLTDATLKLKASRD